jgi:fructokinase
MQSSGSGRNGGLLAIGELLIDALTVNFVKDLSEAHTLALHAGGSPANLCRFVQACGGKATLVAAVGNDGLGRMVLKAIDEAGISVDYIQQLDGHATSLVVVGRSKGTPDFIAYRDADRHLQSVDQKLVHGARVVHSTAFALSKAPAQENILAAFRSAHSEGIAVSVDWNYAEPVWGPGQKAEGIFDQVMACEPLLKVSTDDIERFTGLNGVDEAKAYLQTLPVQVVCLTCGLEGVWFRSSGAAWQHLPAHPVEVKDTTGAGDAFWAGFLTGWMARLSIEECARQGIATAARRLEGKM